MFDLQLAFLEEMKSNYLPDDQGRFYITPYKKIYPSVTTVLSYFSQQEPGLIAWKERVGEEEAERVKKIASFNGRLLHGLAESHLKGEAIDKARVMPQVWQHFVKIRKRLNHHVTKIYGIEVPVYSNIMKVAGRIDLVCDWDGIPSIVDFKTSDKFKPKKFCDSYFQQASAYAVMFQQLTNIPVRSIVLCMVSEGMDSYIHTSKPSAHITDFVTKAVEYHGTEWKRLVEDQGI